MNFISLYPPQHVSWPLRYNHDPFWGPTGSQAIFGGSVHTVTPSQALALRGFQKMAFVGRWKLFTLLQDGPLPVINGVMGPL